MNLPVATCPACNRRVAVRTNGTLHLHMAEVTRPGYVGTIKVACDGSNKPVLKVVERTSVD